MLAGYPVNHEDLLRASHHHRISAPFRRKGTVNGCCSRKASSRPLRPVRDGDVGAYSFYTVGAMLSLTCATRPMASRSRTRGPRPCLDVQNVLYFTPLLGGLIADRLTDSARPS